MTSKKPSSPSIRFIVASEMISSTSGTLLIFSVRSHMSLIFSFVKTSLFLLPNATKRKSDYWNSKIQEDIHIKSQIGRYRGGQLVVVQVQVLQRGAAPEVRRHPARQLVAEHGQRL